MTLAIIILVAAVAFAAVLLANARRDPGTTESRARGRNILVITAVVAAALVILALLLQPFRFQGA